MSQSYIVGIMATFIPSIIVLSRTSEWQVLSDVPFH